MDRARLFVSSLLLVSGAACGNGGGGDGGGGGGPNLPPPRVTVFLSDSPGSDLLSLVASVDSLVLFRQGGGDTGDLLPTAFPVDLASLQGTNLPIASATIQAGIYVSAFLAFTGGIEARSEGGLPVTVSTAIGSATAALPSPLTIANGDEVALQLDVDLTRSLVVSGSGLVFAPLFSPRPLAGGSRVAEFDAVVTAESPSQGTFRADLVPQDSTTPLGSIEVEVEGSDLLVAATGLPFPSAGAFFSALAVGQRVAVRGAWQSAGFVDATSARIETGSNISVEITGPVIAVDPPSSAFVLEIGAIESGAAIAEPVLASFGNPPAILVDFDASTSFNVEDPPATAGSLDLRVGQRVRARFVTFAGFPMRVEAVSIERLEVDFEG